MPIPPTPQQQCEHAPSRCHQIPRAMFPSCLLPSQPTGCHPLKGGSQEGVREEVVLAAFLTVDEENEHGLGKPGAGMGLKDEFTEEQVAQLGLYSKSGRKYGQ